jgi:hypothetical protein
MKRGLAFLALPHWRRLSREMKKFESLDLHAEHGRTELTLRAKRQRATFVRAIASVMATWYWEQRAPNYVEVELNAPILNEEIPPGGTRRIGPLLLTVQRKEGETPHALRRKAEAERDAARNDAALFTKSYEAVCAESTAQQAEIARLTAALDAANATIAALSNDALFLRVLRAESQRDAALPKPLEQVRAAQEVRALVLCTGEGDDHPLGCLIVPSSLSGDSDFFNGLDRLAACYGQTLIDRSVAKADTLSEAVDWLRRMNGRRTEVHHVV